MSLPDLSGKAAQANWYRILEEVLPYTDLFLPNAEELYFMLNRQGFLEHGPDHIPKQTIHDLTERALTMGAQVVGVKAGTDGFYLAARSQFGDLGRGLPVNAAEWHGCRLWTPCFLVDVMGTTGAGDATVAGLLMGWLKSFSPEDAARAAVAVGAASCERRDAISGIRSWPETQSRIESGWPLLEVPA
jgi:sugar/nucleoside kinase (ribokinase family)